MSPITTIVLTTLAAFFFMAATWVMKTWSQTHMVWTMPIIFLLMALAVWVEIEVLRATRMGHVIVIMLALELLMTFAVACFILGEQYTAKEFIGVGVILAGMMMLSQGGETSDLTLTESKKTNVNTVLPKQVEMPNGATFKSSRYAFKTSTPGSALPSIHSRNAPPAVEM